MKLLTLNTHSLIEPDYEAKREIFVNFIAAEQPEVFALQEVNQTAAAPLLGDAAATCIVPMQDWLALAAEKDPAEQKAPKGDLPADHPLRPDELGVTV